MLGGCQCRPLTGSPLGLCTSATCPNAQCELWTLHPGLGAHALPCARPARPIAREDQHAGELPITLSRCCSRLCPSGLQHPLTRLSRPCSHPRPFWMPQGDIAEVQLLSCLPLPGDFSGLRTVNPLSRADTFRPTPHFFAHLLSHLEPFHSHTQNHHRFFPNLQKSSSC